MTEIIPAVRPPPAAAKLPLARLRAAIADRSSRPALLLFGMERSCATVVQQVVASLSAERTFGYELKTSRSRPQIDELMQVLAHSRCPKKATVCLLLPSPTRAWDARVTALAAAMHAHRPDIKWVMLSNARGANGLLLADLEARNVAQLRWDLLHESRYAKTHELLEHSALNVPVDRASELLRPLEPEHVPAVVAYAQLLAKRKRDDGQLGDDDVAELTDAIDNLPRPAPKRGKPQPPPDDYIRNFLWKPPSGISFASTVVDLPEPIRRFVRAIREQEQLRAVVPRINRSLLMQGPPGTGKTTIARAMAAELGYPLLCPKSNAFICKWIGDSANNVARFFEQARALAAREGTPVMVFFDEIDAIARKRGGEGEEEYDRVLNTLLQVLDGIEGRASDDLVIIGATNLRGKLDDGLFSRFARKVEIGLPKSDGLARLFELHLRGRRHDLGQADLQGLGEAAHGLSGRHVDMILNNAGIMAHDVATPEAPACITLPLVRDAMRQVDSEADTSFAQRFVARRLDKTPLREAMAGVPEAIDDFVEMVRDFEARRAVVPRATKTLLLHGPPGTGKTTLALALATELKSELLVVRAVEISSKFFAEGSQNIAKLFAEAQIYARARDTQVIVFIDELDALASVREEGDSGPGTGMVQALLECLEGIDHQACDRIVFVGATNRPEALDPAFKQRIYQTVALPKPKPGTLRAIVRMHLGRRSHEPIADDKLDRALGLAEGFSGRDVVAALDRAGNLCARKRSPGASPSITLEHLEQGIALQRKERDKYDKGPPIGMYT